jgi:hypothetical protein
MYRIDICHACATVGGCEPSVFSYRINPAESPRTSSCNCLLSSQAVPFRRSKKRQYHQTMQRGDSNPDLVDEESELIKKNSVYGANTTSVRGEESEGRKGIDWNNMRTRRQQKQLMSNSPSIFTRLATWFSSSSSSSKPTTSTA